MNFLNVYQKLIKAIGLLASKKLMAIALLLAFTLSAHAQSKNRVKGNGDMVTKTRSVGNYDVVSVGGSFDVKLYAGKEGSIKITVDENLLPYLITEVDNGNLKIKWKKGTSISHRSEIMVTVPFKDIEGVSLAGSGDVSSDDVINANAFKAALAGSGDMKLKLSATSVTAALAGSGDVELSGTTKDLKCAIAGSGDIQAYDLASNNADVKISGSGGIRVSVKDMLSARVSGSGNIYYKGNPTKQDVKVSGSGNVSSR